MITFCSSQISFFNDTATTEIYTLSLHDALPIFSHRLGIKPERRHHSDGRSSARRGPACGFHAQWHRQGGEDRRSEEHTSELQSQSKFVCRLPLEKKIFMGLFGHGHTEL